MITFTEGNLLEARAEVLVNTVNTVGVMGKGIALMFKERTELESVLRPMPQMVPPSVMASSASRCRGGGSQMLHTWARARGCVTDYRDSVFIRTILTRVAASTFLAAPSIAGVGICPECAPCGAG